MRTLGLFALVLTMAACTESSDEMLVPDPAAQLGFGAAGSATYEVTVYNLTGGQPLTPPLAATHRRPVSVFTVGQPASPGIQQIAENGNLAPLEAALNGNRHVMDVVIAGGDPPPILPGGNRSFTITGERGAKWFSVAMMLICTNDGFTGVDAVRLPKRVGESVMLYTDGYDAGTEENTEAWEDLVPPCAMITGFGDQGGTGMTNPDLAENDVIRHHPGIAGNADLDATVHGWTDPVAKIVIERIG